MKCEEFTSWLEEEGLSGQAPLADEMPEEFAKHYRSCPGCQARLREERFWRRFFAAAPAIKPSRTLWPAVLAKIEEQAQRSESFSAAALLLGRRLAPAFALFLVLLGGAALWQGMIIEPQRPGFSLLVLLEDSSEGLELLSGGPDPVLRQWVGMTE